MKQNQKIAVAVFLLVFATTKVAMLVWWQNQKNSSQSVSSQAMMACKVAVNGCHFGQNAHFQLLDVQKNDSVFRIKATGLPENTQQIFASFSMSNMDMGFNQFDLKKQTDGSWYAENVRLPLCTQSRHDWVVEWTLYDGQSKQTYQANFQTMP